MLLLLVLGKLLMAHSSDDSAALVTSIDINLASLEQPFDETFAPIFGAKPESGLATLISDIQI